MKWHSLNCFETPYFGLHSEDSGKIFQAEGYTTTPTICTFSFYQYAKSWDQGDGIIGKHPGKPPFPQTLSEIEKMPKTAVKEVLHSWISPNATAVKKSTF